MEKTTQKAIKETLNELNQLDFGLIAHLDSLEVEHDDIVEINEAINIAITIPKVSNQSKSRNKNMVFIPKAINRILIMGSPRDSKNSFIIPFCFAFVISLLPYFFLCSITSLFVSPFNIKILLTKYMLEKNVL